MAITDRAISIVIQALYARTFTTAAITASISIRIASSVMTKEQRDEVTRRFRRTPKGVLTNIYAAQRTNSPKRGFGPVGYTLKQFHERFLVDPRFLQLHQAWLALGCPYREKPSVDRIDPLKGYTLENVQIMTWAENHAKGMAEASLTHGHGVIQLDMNGNEIARFESMAEASAKTGVCRSSLPKACDGRYRQCGGYRWRYVDSFVYHD